MGLFLVHIELLLYKSTNVRFNLSYDIKITLLGCLCENAKILLYVCDTVMSFTTLFLPVIVCPSVYRLLSNCVTMDTRYMCQHYVIKYAKLYSSLLILLHGIILHPDITSYDKKF